MTHSFLFEEGLWDMTGQVTRESGTYASSAGARIVHWPGVWLIEWAPGEGSEDPDHAERSVEVSPAEEGSDHTAWTAFDSVLGKQHGNFVFVDDTILSSFTCSEGERRGVEFLRRLDDDRYECGGALLEGTRRLATWSYTLTRRTTP